MSLVLLLFSVRWDKPKLGRAHAATHRADLPNSGERLPISGVDQPQTNGFSHGGVASRHAELRADRIVVMGCGSGLHGQSLRGLAALDALGSDTSSLRDASRTVILVAAT